MLRFAHSRRRDGGRARAPRWHKLRFLARDLLDAAGCTRVALPTGRDEADGHLYLRRQAPTCAGLLLALHSGAARWDAAVFFTALYYPTAEGLPIWERRSVLVPALHDERAMYLPWFHRVFGSAGLTLFNTAAEQRLAGRLYGRSVGESLLVGAGVPVQAPVASSRIEAARRRSSLPERYLVYFGRVEAANGCADLLNAWQSACARLPQDTAIAFIGGGDVTMPVSPRIVRTGYFDVDLRDALITSEVLRDHLTASGAGVAYRGQSGLADAIGQALLRPAAEWALLGQRGGSYVGKHFNPEWVCRQWLKAVEHVCGSAASA